MKYNVLVRIPTMIEVEASSEEEAKKRVYDNLVATNQIKPTDYVKIAMAIFQRR